MYGGFEVFKIYLAVKLHFTTDKYDYSKYDGQINAKLENFTKRNDRYFFHKLSTRYGKDDILDFFVSNFLIDSKKWVGNLLKNDGKYEYDKFRLYKENINESFRRDCIVIFSDFNNRRLSFDYGFSVFGGQHPRALQLLIQKKIGYQTALILDHYLSYIKDWDLQIKEKVVWKDISKKIKKFKPFFHFNSVECKQVLKEVFIDGK